MCSKMAEVQIWVLIFTNSKSLFSLCVFLHLLLSCNCEIVSHVPLFFQAIKQHLIYWLLSMDVVTSIAAIPLRSHLKEFVDSTTLLPFWAMKGSKCKSVVESLENICICYCGELKVAKPSL